MTPDDAVLKHVEPGEQAGGRGLGVRTLNVVMPEQDGVGITRQRVDRRCRLAGVAVAAQPIRPHGIHHDDQNVGRIVTVVLGGPDPLPRPAADHGHGDQADGCDGVESCCSHRGIPGLGPLPALPVPGSGLIGWFRTPLPPADAHEAGEPISSG